MAIQVSPVYLSDYRSKRFKSYEEPKWRLSRHRIEDIQNVASGIEETDVGICCRYLVDHLTAVGSQEIDEDGYIHHLDPIENFCHKFNIWNDPGHHPEIKKWRDRLSRSRRTFQRMREENRHAEAAILHMVYGHRDPSIVEFPQKVIESLGELAPLARFTDRVELHRIELARQEAVRLSGCRLPEEIIHSQADEDERRSRAIRQGHRPEYGPILIDLMRHRDKYDWALKVVTSGNALRSLFTPCPNRGATETKEYFEVRKENFEVKQGIVLSEIKIQATEMLKQASICYRETWLCMASP